MISLCSRSSRAVLVAALALAGLALTAQPAAAHGDAAVLAVEAQDLIPAGVHLEVSARYENDDELVADAVIAVTGTGPGGETLAATPLTAVPDTEGLYAADLDLPAPGVWTLQVRATEPEGAIDVSVSVPAETTTTVAETTTTAASATTTPEEAEDSDGSSSALPLVIGGVVLVAVAAGGVVLVRRRRSGV